MTVNDGSTDSAAARTTVNVAPVNDPPTVSTFAGYGVNEDDGPRVIPGVSLTDPDGGSGELSLALNVGNGALDFGSTAGLTLAGGAYSSPTITVTGHSPTSTPPWRRLHISRTRTSTARTP